MVAKLFMEKKG